MTAKDLDKSLIDYLKQAPDERSPGGRRHPLWLILPIMILGIMIGDWGYRKVWADLSNGIVNLPLLLSFCH